MPRPAINKTLRVKLDARMAATYRTAYERAFGSEMGKRQSLAEFITGFVHDRLAEEIDFAKGEVSREAK